MGKDALELRQKAFKGKNDRASADTGVEAPRANSIHGKAENEAHVAAAAVSKTKGHDGLPQSVVAKPDFDGARAELSTPAVGLAAEASVGAKVGQQADILKQHKTDSDAKLGSDKLASEGSLAKVEAELPPQHLRDEMGALADLALVEEVEKLMVKPVHKGRVDYGFRMDEDLKNFVYGEAEIFDGKLKNDLYLINFGDKDKHIGPYRSLKWFGSLKEVRGMNSIDDLYQRYALVYPDWGERNEFTIIKIPAGTEISYVKGTAKFQYSRETGLEFYGGGEQYRLKSFDYDWVEEMEIHELEELAEVHKYIDKIIGEGK